MKGKKAMQTFTALPGRIAAVVKDKFRFSTLSFLFVVTYANVFPLIFGPENSIVGVIFTVLMSASMVRDLTATPLRNLVIQAFVLVWMALAAYGVNVLPAPLSLLINFITLFLILYAFTYEYSSHRYFPYILSYLFLLFISPVTEASKLPARLMGMFVGAVSIMLYQWFMGRKRVVETARDVLTEMIDDSCLYISFRLGETDRKPEPSDIRHRLCLLSQTVYQRRKKALCVSDAGFSMIAVGRGLEHLLILIKELPASLSEREKEMLRSVKSRLLIYRSFLQQERTGLPALSPIKPTDAVDEKAVRLFYNTFAYINDRLYHMTDPQNKSHYPKTALDLKIRLQAALDISPVRAVYALRTALILALATLAVQLPALPHGKWLLFTLASVSLPYADDVPAKIKKRVLATVIGGLFSVIIYWLVPSAAGRTAAMMFSGYLSFFFSDYTATFACSTVGALGGAVIMDAFGFAPVARMFLIRLGYILAGALIGYGANCLLCPFRRGRATRQLFYRYRAITGLLAKAVGTETVSVDPQLYYHLIISAHMIEEKLTDNAGLEGWKELPELMERCREKVRNAHRPRLPQRPDAPPFESGHLA